MMLRPRDIKVGHSVWVDGFDGYPVGWYEVATLPVKRGVYHVVTLLGKAEWHEKKIIAPLHKLEFIVG